MGMVDVSDSLNATNGDTRFFQDFYFGDQNVGSPPWMTMKGGNSPIVVYSALAVGAVFLYLIIKKKKRA